METRSLIDDVFNIAENVIALSKIRKETTKSVIAMFYLNVRLLGLVISLEFGKKIDLQKTSELWTRMGTRGIFKISNQMY